MAFKFAVSENAVAEKSDVLHEYGDLQTQAISDRKSAAIPEVAVGSRRRPMIILKFEV